MILWILKNFFNHGGCPRGYAKDLPNAFLGRTYSNKSRAAGKNILGKSNDTSSRSIQTERA